MGIKPIAYRAMHELKKRTGVLKKDFPTTFLPQKFILLEEWRKKSPAFFFNSKEDLIDFKLEDSSTLKSDFQNLQQGRLKFFHGEVLNLGKSYDWLTNPDTQFSYKANKHWTELETLDAKAGDIKYVWEKSRFSYLYTIIRYDYHFKEDQSEFALSEIISWIDRNPLNMGPNFSCSQELSIRMLNWIFVLYYYKNSPSLTEERFQKILNSIYWQTKHVETHISFSLQSVRNNHAVTESLLLYAIGLLFPFFNSSAQWKKAGKKYLEQEALYQIYEDGSYLQYSMNYQRVVLQLYTWAFYLSYHNKETFSSEVYLRVAKSMDFLYQHQDETSGMLPNYGANDGALFFPLNSSSFRDYRPQLNALYYFFQGTLLYEKGIGSEDLFWYTNKIISDASNVERKSQSYKSGGYFVLREPEKFSFIRCGSHRDRPSQADNLHLDIWVKGKNILRDAGSYKYNSSMEDIRYFMGTASHNTVMIDEYDQMEKGGRFLWFYWSEAIESEIKDHEEYQLFKGKIHGYKHIKDNIYHTRIVKQYKKELKWEIEDFIENNSLPVKQTWNISPEFFNESFQITSRTKDGLPLSPLRKEAFYSPTYGVKEKSEALIFESRENYFKTTIFKR